MELNSQKDLKTVLGINKAMPATNTFSGNKHLRSSTHNGQLPIQFTNLGHHVFSHFDNCFVTYSTLKVKFRRLVARCIWAPKV